MKQLKFIKQIVIDIFNIRGCWIVKIWTGFLPTFSHAQSREKVSANFQPRTKQGESVCQLSVT